MRIEDLNIFLNIARYQSISEAARCEHFTQPAVSSILHSLENQLGVKLIERHERQRTPLKLTVEGEILKQYSEQIISDYQNLLLDIAYKNITQTPLTIGSGRSFSILIFPTLARQFQKEYTNVHLEMKTYANTELALNALMQQKCSIVLSSVSNNTPGLLYERLMDEPFLLTCPLDMNIPDEITIRQLSKLPLIMREKNSFSYLQIQSALSRHGINIDNLNIVLTVHDNASIKQAVELWNGCGFVPRSAVSNTKIHHHDFKIVRIKGVNINRSIYLVRRESDLFEDSLKLFWIYATSGKWYKDLFIYDPREL